jgi:hypothetical protein
MEVHHHGHHPKKLKEYLTEFLMLFLAVSMGFIAENIREKYTENERSDELMKSFISDVRENQKQLDSIIINNQQLIYYYDSLAFNHSFGNPNPDLKELSEKLDTWVYRFTNKKTIFEQMKSSGALRYIRDKDILEAMLRYEESANAAETRSLIEIDQYNNEFRPAIANILPLSFYKYLSDEESTKITKLDSIVHPGRYENYKIYRKAIKNDLEGTKLSKEQFKALAKAWHFRQERIAVGLRFQILLREQGSNLLKQIEPKYKD